MISLKELNQHNYPTTPDIDKNLLVLLERVNKVRLAWGNPMTVTSGLRSDTQQKQLIAAGKSNATKSHHLMGEAADVADEGLKLTQWLKANPKILEDAQLWCEEGNKNWVHFQIVPPHSGHRWFLP